MITAPATTPERRSTARQRPSTRGRPTARPPAELRADAGAWTRTAAVAGGCSRTARTAFVYTGARTPTGGTESTLAEGTLAKPARALAESARPVAEATAEAAAHAGTRTRALALFLVGLCLLQALF